MRKERRKDPRIDLFVQDKIKHHGLYNVKNLSLSGLFIQMPNPSQFQTGNEIEVVMQLPAEDKPTHLDVQVRRVATNGVGVAFVKVPPKQQVALQYCVDVFKHTVHFPIADKET